MKTKHTTAILCMVYAHCVISISSLSLQPLHSSRRFGSNHFRRSTHTSKETANHQNTKREVMPRNNTPDSQAEMRAVGQSPPRDNTDLSIKQLEVILAECQKMPIKTCQDTYVPHTYFADFDIPPNYDPTRAENEINAEEEAKEKRARQLSPRQSDENTDLAEYNAVNPEALIDQSLLSDIIRDPSIEDIIFIRKDVHDKDLEATMKNRCENAAKQLHILKKLRAIHDDIWRRKNQELANLFYRPVPGTKGIDPKPVPGTKGIDPKPIPGTKGIYQEPVSDPTGVKILPGDLNAGTATEISPTTSPATTGQTDDLSNMPTGEVDSTTDLLIVDSTTDDLSTRRPTNVEFIIETTGTADTETTSVTEVTSSDITGDPKDVTPDPTAESTDTTDDVQDISGGTETTSTGTADATQTTDPSSGPASDSPGTAETGTVRGLSDGGEIGTTTTDPQRNQATGATSEPASESTLTTGTGDVRDIPEGEGAGTVTPTMTETTTVGPVGLTTETVSETEGTGGTQCTGEGCETSGTGSTDTTTQVIDSTAEPTSAPPENAETGTVRGLGNNDEPLTTTADPQTTQTIDSTTEPASDSTQTTGTGDIREIREGAGTSTPSTNDPTTTTIFTTEPAPDTKVMGDDRCNGDRCETTNTTKALATQTTFVTSEPASDLPETAETGTVRGLSDDSTTLGTTTTDPQTAETTDSTSDPAADSTQTTGTGDVRDIREGAGTVTQITTDPTTIGTTGLTSEPAPETTGTGGAQCSGEGCETPGTGKGGTQCSGEGCETPGAGNGSAQCSGEGCETPGASTTDSTTIQAIDSTAELTSAPPETAETGTVRGLGDGGETLGTSTPDPQTTQTVDLAFEPTSDSSQTTGTGDIRDIREGADTFTPITTDPTTIGTPGLTNDPAPETTAKGDDRCNGDGCETPGGTTTNAPTTQTTGLTSELASDLPDSAETGTVRGLSDSSETLRTTTDAPSTQTPASDLLQTTSTGDIRDIREGDETATPSATDPSIIMTTGTSDPTSDSSEAPGTDNIRGTDDPSGATSTVVSTDPSSVSTFDGTTTDVPSGSTPIPTSEEPTGDESTIQDLKDLRTEFLKPGSELPTTDPSTESMSTETSNSEQDVGPTAGSGDTTHGDTTATTQGASEVDATTVPDPEKGSGITTGLPLVYTTLLPPKKDESVSPFHEQISTSNHTKLVLEEESHEEIIDDFGSDEETKPAVIEAPTSSDPEKDPGVIVSPIKSDGTKINSFDDTKPPIYSENLMGTDSRPSENTPDIKGPSSLLPSPSGDPSDPKPDSQSPLGDPSDPKPDSQSPSGDPSDPKPDSQSPSGDPSDSKPNSQSPSDDPSDPKPDSQSPSDDPSDPKPDSQSPPGDPSDPKPDSQSPPGDHSDPKPDSLSSLDDPSDPQPDSQSPPGDNSDPKPDSLSSLDDPSDPKPDSQSPPGDPSDPKPNSQSASGDPSDLNPDSQSSPNEDPVSLDEQPIVSPIKPKRPASPGTQVNYDDKNMVPLPDGSLSLSEDDVSNGGTQSIIPDPKPIEAEESKIKNKGVMTFPDIPKIDLNSLVKNTSLIDLANYLSQRNNNTSAAALKDKIDQSFHHAEVNLPLDLGPMKTDSKFLNGTKKGKISQKELKNKIETAVPNAIVADGLLNTFFVILLSNNATKLNLERWTEGMPAIEVDDLCVPLYENGTVHDFLSITRLLKGTVYFKNSRSKVPIRIKRSAARKCWSLSTYDILKKKPPSTVVKRTISGGPGTRTVREPDLRNGPGPPLEKERNILPVLMTEPGIQIVPEASPRREPVPFLGLRMEEAGSNLGSQVAQKVYPINGSLKGSESVIKMAPSSQTNGGGRVLKEQAPRGKPSDIPLNIGSASLRNSNLEPQFLKKSNLEGETLEQKKSLGKTAPYPQVKQEAQFTKTQIPTGVPSSQSQSATRFSVVNNNLGLQRNISLASETPQRKENVGVLTPLQADQHEQSLREQPFRNGYTDPGRMNVPKPSNFNPQLSKIPNFESETTQHQETVNKNVYQKTDHENQSPKNQVPGRRPLEPLMFAGRMNLLTEPASQFAKKPDLRSRSSLRERRRNDLPVSSVNASKPLSGPDLTSKTSGGERPGVQLLERLSSKGGIAPFREKGGNTVANVRADELSLAEQNTLLKQFFKLKSRINAELDSFIERPVSIYDTPSYVNKRKS